MSERLCTHTHSPSPRRPFGRALLQRNWQGRTLAVIPKTLYRSGLWPAHVSVRAGWGPSPTGVRTHVAFTDLIPRSEAGEAASVTFTNTGSRLWGRHTPLAHNRLQSRSLYRADPHARDRNSPSQPLHQGQTRTPSHSLHSSTHTCAHARTHV